MDEIAALQELWSTTAAAALATVVEVRGSAYRRPGARMLMTIEGQHSGVINGGCLDADLWRRAHEVMVSGQAQLAVYDSTAPEDILWGLGLGCRGVVKILVEPVQNLDWLSYEQTVAVQFEGENLGTQLSPETVSRPHIQETESGRAFVQRLETPLPLLIFGAGADVVPLARIGEVLGWKVHVIDPRPSHPERVNYLEASHIAPEALKDEDIPENAACVIMTHNFIHDLELLKVLLPSRATYIGILGPRSRTDDLLSRLGRNTLRPAFEPEAEQLEKLHAPIGLDLGSETPDEIALSIVSEIQRFRRGASGESLRNRDSIH